jgi:hypothetical protein
MAKNICASCLSHMAKARPDTAAKAANASSIPAMRGLDTAKWFFIAHI